MERLGSHRAWWKGLVPKGYLKFDMKNEHLPKPILKAYLFSEWTYDTPPVPNGTTLWVEQNPGVEVGEYQIWYSPLDWDLVLEYGGREWEYVGRGFWEAP